MNDFGSERYAIRVYPDLCTDGSYCWVAEHPDLPGCSVDAETIEEAKRLLDAARVAYLDVIARDHIPAPEPSSEYVEWQTHYLDDVEGGEQWHTEVA